MALRALLALDFAYKLWLQECNLTDDGLLYVGKMHELRVLYLDGNPVTDDGLAYLSELPHLEVLSVTDTCVTANGVARFRISHPRCRVEYSRNTCSQ